MTMPVLSYLFSLALFAKSYDLSSSATALQALPTPDRGYLMTGYIITDDYHIFAMKTGAAGNVLWARMYSTTKSDWANRVVPTSDGGYAMAGWTLGTPDARKHILLVKINASGDLEWAKIYTYAAPLSGGQGNYLLQTSDGGFVLAGADGYRGAIIKVDDTGAVEWARECGPLYDSMFGSLVETSNGNILVAGTYAKGFGTSYTHLILYNFSPTGALVWSKAYAWDTTDYYGYSLFMRVIETADRGFLICGTTRYGSTNARSATLLKTDSAGSVRWAFAIPGFTTLTPITIDPEELPNGDIVLAGQYSNYSGMALCLDTVGNIQWAWKAKWNWDHIYSMDRVWWDGGFIMAGFDQVPFSDRKVLLIRTESDGLYPGCLVDTTPGVYSLTMDTVPSYSTDTLAVSSSEITMTVANLSPTVQDMCPPLYIGFDEDNGAAGSSPRCSLAPGAALFLVDEPVEITLYSVDGRVIRYLELGPGRHRVDLDKGIYFWKAGERRGKVVIR